MLFPFIFASRRLLFRGVDSAPMAIAYRERPADNAVTGIVLMNIVVIVVALVSGEGLLMMMWPYWLQSLVIGYYNVRRIQKLQRFSTEGFKINDRAVDPTPSTRRTTWMFFAFHYGFFHFGYMVFLLAFSAGMPMTDESGARIAYEVGGLASWSPIWFAAAVIGYVMSHGQSHREHVEADLRGTPNIGKLMFVPYIRIIPMHLTIIVGAMLGNGLGLLLFGSLKTVADVAMHKVEHRMLQGTIGAPAGVEN